MKEISWRATLLISFTDELITVPNRTMTQAEISNFSAKSQPVIRGHYLYVPYGTSLALVKTHVARSGGRHERFTQVPGTECFNS